MKNFSELLATDLKLDVVVNGTATAVYLHDNLIFDANDTVVIDCVEILPRYHYLAVNGTLTIDIPFYQWYHKISAQGWLLTPH